MLASGVASAQPTGTLSGCIPNRPDNLYSENLVALAKDVADAHRRQAADAVHPGASLLKAPEIKRAVQTGKVQVQVGEVLSLNAA